MTSPDLFGISVKSAEATIVTSTRCCVLWIRTPEIITAWIQRGFILNPRHQLFGVIHTNGALADNIIILFILGRVYKLRVIRKEVACIATATLIAP